MPSVESHRTILMVKSTVVQVMAWCHKAPSHYLSQCWSSSMSPTYLLDQCILVELSIELLSCLDWLLVIWKIRKRELTWNVAGPLLYKVSSTDYDLSHCHLGNMTMISKVQNFLKTQYISSNLGTHHAHCEIARSGECQRTSLMRS